MALAHLIITKMALLFSEITKVALILLLVLHLAGFEARRHNP